MPTPTYASPLPIGAIFTRSGGIVALGDDSFDGAEVARLIVNARGGIAGRPVQWVVADAETPDSAAAHAERMIREQGVRAIVGCYGSDHTIAVSKVCERLGAVLFAQTAWTAHLFDHRPRFTFRVNTFANPVEEAAVAYVDEHALPALGQRLSEVTVMVVHESSGYGRSCAEETVAALNRRGKSPADVLSYDYRYGTGHFDADGVAKRIGAVAPTVLFASSFVADAVELLKAMHRAGTRPSVVMTSSAGFGLYTLNLAGALTEGVLSANAPALVASAALTDSGRVLQTEFIRTLKGVSGREPSGFNAMSFCAAWALLADVLPKAGAPDDAESIRAAALAADVPEGSYPNAWGLKFDATGQNTRCPASVDEWQDGRLLTIWPALLATTQRRSIVPFTKERS